MARRRQQRPLIAQLAQTAAVHDRHAVAGLRHYAQIVGDHDDGDAQLLTQLRQQPQDLHLHRNVQRGGRFVGDQNLRLARQRHGDHRPLAHAAGKLVRVIAGPSCRVGDADLLQQRDRFITCRAMATAEMQAAAFGDLLANGHHRIEVTGGVLKNHPQLPSTNVGHLRVVQLHHILAVEPHLASDDAQPCPRQQPHQRPAGQGLAGAGFPHQPQHFAFLQRKGNPVHQPDSLAILQRQFVYLQQSVYIHQSVYIQ